MTDHNTVSPFRSFRIIQRSLREDLMSRVSARHVEKRNLAEASPTTLHLNSGRLESQWDYRPVLGHFHHFFFSFSHSKTSVVCNADVPACWALVGHRNRDLVSQPAGRMRLVQPGRLVHAVRCRYVSAPWDLTISQPSFGDEWR